MTKNSGGCTLAAHRQETGTIGGSGSHEQVLWNTVMESHLSFEKSSLGVE